ncbi:MAG TPA: hypothetical protein VFI26_01650 [Lysobacter sp.]|nr:hypothetical protein [Lysobacter sp.]
MRDSHRAVSRYVICWRILMAAFFVSLATASIGLFLEKYPFRLFGSVELSRFVIMYWWLITMCGIFLTAIIGPLLVLFDIKTAIWIRILVAASSIFVFPILPFVGYWLIRVERPLRAKP